MPPTVYNYTISVDFPNNKVDIPSLTSEIAAALPAPAPQVDPNSGGIGVKITGADDCGIWFDAALDAGQEITLGGVVAAHTGIGVIATMFGTSELANLPFSLVEIGPAFEDVGGVVTTPSFFNPDMSRLMGRCLGQIKTDGGDAEFKICETTALGVTKDMSSLTVIPDTGGLWQVFRIDTNVLPTDASWNTYKLVGRKNTTPNVSIRFATFSLLQVILT